MAESDYEEDDFEWPDDAPVQKSGDRLFGHLPQYRQTKAQIKQLRNMADNGNKLAQEALKAIEHTEKELSKQVQAMVFDKGH